MSFAAPEPPAGFQVFPVEGAFFFVPKRYNFGMALQSGGQGQICAAYDRQLDKQVAIKKFKVPFKDDLHAKRVFREIKLMRTIRHKNIVPFMGTFSPQQTLNQFQDVYLVTELMDTDLSEIVKMEIDAKRLSYIIYQICCGISFLHSVGIMHRDLKPSNIGVNARCCIVRILDFGLACSSKRREFTPYVITRYYRAPEVVLGIDYNENIDVWSIGCIFGEFITRNPIFPGITLVDQWNKIVATMGTPEKRFIDKLRGPARLYVESLPCMQGVPFAQLFPDQRIPQCNINTLTAQNARDLLSRMLVVNPANRISARDALKHPYLSGWFEEADIAKPSELHVDPTINIETNDVQEYRKLIFKEVVDHLHQERNRSSHH